jgi:gamma-glutamylcyclotransferase (GGCT)/AIG2-like uncharacterized protein YtfP
MIRQLFVYGSLMPHMGGPFARAERARLAAESEIAGPGDLRGWLFNLGNYPGLLLANGDPSANTVHGVLLRLSTPLATFQWLDPFEDIEPGRDLDMNAYERVKATVASDGGKHSDAWVYVMRRVGAGAVEIPSGRWHAPTH